jgi:hypothetical protein
MVTTPVNALPAATASSFRDSWSILDRYRAFFFSVADARDGGNSGAFLRFAYRTSKCCEHTTDVPFWGGGGVTAKGSRRLIVPASAAKNIQHQPKGVQSRRPQEKIRRTGPSAGRRSFLGGRRRARVCSKQQTTSGVVKGRAVASAAGKDWTAVPVPVWGAGGVTAKGSRRPMSSATNNIQHQPW